MTVAELIEQLRQIPDDFVVYRHAEYGRAPVHSVVTVDDQPGGTSYVVIS